MKDDIRGCATIVTLTTSPIMIQVAIPDYVFVDEEPPDVMRKKLDDMFRQAVKLAVGELYESFLKGVERHV